jgi:Leucine-rich repeat (LRR) protein
MSSNTALTILGCSFNQLTSLDVSNNTALEALACDNNQLTSLDVSSNTALEGLGCDYNQLTSLDVSTNTALKVLYCSDNELECLNVKNGNNTAFEAFVAYVNQNLTCIEVDDAEWSTSNWTDYIDPQTSFSEDCDDDCDDPTLGINELTTTKNLIQILDLMGRETSFKPNTPLIYVYDDGSIEKVFSVEY